MLGQMLALMMVYVFDLVLVDWLDWMVVNLLDLV